MEKLAFTPQEKEQTMALYHSVFDLIAESLQPGDLEHMRQHLADAMEKVAERPTTQHIVYPQDGSTANVGCEMQSPEFKMFPLSGAPVQQTTIDGGLSNE